MSTRAPRPTILLFDLDGTLMTTAGAGREAFARAFARRHGAADVARRIEFAGMTDRAIARAGLEAAGLRADEAAIDALLAAYLAELDLALATAPRLAVLDGVLAALEAAARRERTAAGLGTGNLREGARRKLAKVGLWERFGFGGFADDSEDRPTLLDAGARRGAERLGLPLAGCRVVVIGDTPRDASAARANGFECLLVATGNYSLAELRPLGAEHLCASLADAAALAALTAP